MICVALIFPLIVKIVFDKEEHKMTIRELTIDLRETYNSTNRYSQEYTFLLSAKRLVTLISELTDKKIHLKDYNTFSAKEDFLRAQLEKAKQLKEKAEYELSNCIRQTSPIEISDYYDLINEYQRHYCSDIPTNALELLRHAFCAFYGCYSINNKGELERHIMNHYGNYPKPEYRIKNNYGATIKMNPDGTVECDPFEFHEFMMRSEDDYWTNYYTDCIYPEIALWKNIIQIKQIDNTIFGLTANGNLVHTNYIKGTLYGEEVTKGKKYVAISDEWKNIVFFDFLKNPPGYYTKDELIAITNQGDILAFSYRLSTNKYRVSSLLELLQSVY